MLKNKETTVENIGINITKDRLPHLEDGWAIGSILKFDPEILAQSKWHEMIAGIQQDRRERLVRVYYKKRGLEIGPVEIGDKVEGQNSNDHVFPESPRRKLANLFKQELLSVHTHHKPEDPGFLAPTTPFSDTDINRFLASSQKALVMIDVGGVHVLARKPFSSFALDNETDEPLSHAKESLTQVNTNSRLVMDVMKGIATKLKPLDVGYYYSSSLEPNSEGFIEVTDVLKPR